MLGRVSYYDGHSLYQGIWHMLAHDILVEKMETTHWIEKQWKRPVIGMTTSH